MADITVPVGGRTDFQLLFKDQGSGAYAEAMQAVTASGNLTVPVGGRQDFQLLYVQVSPGVYAIAVQAV